MVLAHPPASRHPAVRGRSIPLEGAFNCRDLGGHPAGDRTVRTRLVHRSDGLHRLSHADVSRLRRLGIRTVVDLRSTEERERYGVCDAARLGAVVRHVPLVERPWPMPEPGEQAATWLARRYLELLSSSADAIVAVLALLADSDNWPVVVHCTGGKDRTGVVSAVLLSLLGVSADDVVDDYCRSTPGITWLRQSLESNAAGEALRLDVPDALFEVPAAAMWLLLDAVAAEHGSMEGWARSAGVPPSLVRALRVGLLA